MITVRYLYGENTRCLLNTRRNNFRSENTRSSIRNTSSISEDGKSIRGAVFSIAQFPVSIAAFLVLSN